MRLRGADELIGALHKRADLGLVKKTVKLNGTELERSMKRNASFDKGYQTGETKRSINLTLEEDGMTARVGPTTHYSPYLELGTRFMEAQPFVGPSFHSQKVKLDRKSTRLNSSHVAIS